MNAKKAKELRRLAKKFVLMNPEADGGVLWSKLDQTDRGPLVNDPLSYRGTVRNFKKMSK
jgi:hypothetical protein